MTLDVGSLVGTVLGGRYRLDAELGAGGMGAVFRARDEELSRDVAVKVLLDANQDAERRERLMHEARAAAALQHPGIAGVYDVGVDGSLPFVVMELVHGRSLRETPPGSPARIVEIALGLCEALEHAHGRGVVHRDLKPENVLLVDDDGGVKLVDLGLALAPRASRLTREGTVLGTPAYLAPEQALGQTVDGRTDLYSLGAVLYELLAGRPPFVGEDVLGVVSQHLHAPVVPIRTFRADVPADLERVVLRLLAKSPEQRFAGAAELAEALRSIDLATSSAAPASTGAVALLDQLVRGRLVGRRAELDELRALWRRSQQGHCHVALVSGEPGAGKTRLAREVVVQAQLEGAVVLRGGCYEYEATTPYLPIVEALRRWVRDESDDALRTHAGPLASGLVKLVPELASRLGSVTPPPPLDPAEERLRLFDHIARLLQSLAAARGLLLFVDDLHWADQGTLSMLHYAVRQLAGQRVMVLATYREVELGRDHPLAAALLDWNRERLATRVGLSRLSHDDTNALLATLLNQDSVSPEFGDAVYRETEGNPFFVEEVIKALIDQGQIYRDGGEWSRKDIEEISIPQSVKVAVGHRLSRLSDGCVEVLRAAAALGKEFAFRDLAAASDRNEDALLDALDEATGAQLVASQDADTFVFTHDKIREVLYEEMNPIRRRRLHQRVGEGLERVHAASLELHAEDLSHHFCNSGDLERGLRYSVLAGKHAERVFAHDEALEFYRHARECAEGLERPEALQQVEEAMAGVQGQRGDSPAAAEHYLRALELSRDPSGRARLKAAIGETLVTVGDARAMKYIEEALAELDPVREPRERATALMAAGRHHHLAGLHTRAAELLKESLEMAEPTGDAQLQALIMSYLSGAYQHLARFDESDAWARRTVALGEATQDPVAIASGYEFLAENAVNQGHCVQAIEWSRRELEVVRRIHAGDREAWTHFCLAAAHIVMGSLAEAAREARETIAMCDRIGERRLRVFAQGVYGSALADLGLWDESEGLLKQAAEAADQARLVFMQCETRRGLAYLARMQGRFEEALRQAGTVHEILGTREARMPPVRIGPIEVEVLIRLRRLEEAESRWERALALAREGTMRPQEMELVRCGAELAALSGDRARAEVEFEAARAGLESIAARSLEARTLVIRSLWRRSWNEVQGAQQDHDRAQALFTECGAEGMRREAAVLAV